MIKQLSPWYGRGPVVIGLLGSKDGAAGRAPCAWASTGRAAAPRGWSCSSGSRQGAPVGTWPHEEFSGVRSSCLWWGGRDVPPCPTQGTHTASAAEPWLPPRCLSPPCCPGSSLGSDLEWHQRYPCVSAAFSLKWGET